MSQEPHESSEEGMNADHVPQGSRSQPGSDGQSDETLSKAGIPFQAGDQLLFGVIALQNNFVTREQFVSAFDSWVQNKSRPLAEILIRRGNLSTSDRDLLERLVSKFLIQNGGSVQQSLESLRSIPTVQIDLQRLQDQDLQVSLGFLGASRDSSNHLESATVLYSAGHELGRFRILRPHAKGGLGLVSVALDKELNREVALKEIQPRYADDPSSRDRFVMEAEITGGLEHPGIVPVYALGRDANGRPFYAMRFVKGDSLKEAIDNFHSVDNPVRKDSGERQFALRQLLRRFIDVCNAIEYAHSRGVLHRDLKPGNIIVGKYGETLVVDWGLAKVKSKPTDPPDHTQRFADEPTLRPLSGSQVEPTVAGAVVGTPQFMSPEQASGKINELGPASDIYSLGSTLYVILTGTRPYLGADNAEILSKVRQGLFEPPKRLAPDTPAALNAICCKAMAFVPQDRYATAVDFATDIERWLADEPVAAFPESWSARLIRWARNHRIAVAGTAAFLSCAVVALAISTALISAEQVKTVKQKRIAEANYKSSRDQSFQIIKLIESSEPEFAVVPALHQRRRELLTTSSDACREFLKQDPDNVDLIRRASQIFRFTGNFHRLTYETILAEQFYQDSIGLRKPLVAMFPKEELLLADTLRDYASLQLLRGRINDAAEKFSSSLEIVQRSGINQNQPAFRRTVALARMNLAIIDHRLGNHSTTGSTENIQTAEQLIRALVTGNPYERIPYDPILLASALNLHAMMESEAGHLGEAETLHKEAASILVEIKKTFLKTVNEADIMHTEAACRIRQAQTWVLIGKPSFIANAEKLVEAAIINLGILVRNYPSIPIYQEAMAAAHNELGRIHRRLALEPDARERVELLHKAHDDFEKARELNQGLVGKYPDLPELQWELANSYAGLGLIAKDLKDPEVREDQGAKALFKRSEIERLGAVSKSPDDVRYQRRLQDSNTIEP